MYNGTSENSRNTSSSRSLDPAKSRRLLSRASRDSNQEKPEKSDTSGQIGGSKASELFNFKEVGVFVSKNHNKTKSFGSSYSRKQSNSNKSSVHSISKHSDESLDRPDARNLSKQDSSDFSNKTANDDSNSQNASYHNVLSDLNPHHQQKKSAELNSNRNPYENGNNKPSLLPRNNSIQQVNPKQEDTNELTKPIDLISPSEVFELNSEKTTSLVKEKRIAVPVASRIVNEDVIQRIKNKVNSNTQMSNPGQYSFSNSFLSEFLTSKAREKRADFHTDAQDEESGDCRKRPSTTPILISN